MVYASPLWRRALGLSCFDGSSALVPGRSYDYRISASFASDRKIFGFHTVPTGTALPSDFYLNDCRLRLASPTVVVRAPSVPETGDLVYTRRGIVLNSTRSLPWLAQDLARFSAVIDFAEPVTEVLFELDPGHQLMVEAGSAWGNVFSPAISLPPGPNSKIVLAQPATQLRLSGKGVLFAFIVAPGPLRSEMVVIPGIKLVNTPLPAPPTLARAISLQSDTALLPANLPPKPRAPLGVEVSWNPAAMITGWTIPGSSPPLDATSFRVERQIEGSNTWKPVMTGDNLVLGSRHENTRDTTVVAGVDLMQIFPESRGPEGSSSLFSYRDVFLEGPDGEAKPNPPKPGTRIRYRVGAVDAIGRASATFTQTDLVRLEKHEPPPLPSDPVEVPTASVSAAPKGVQASVLVRGGDLTPEQVTLLGTSNNAIVLRWGWHAKQRAIDPFMTHFRVYVAPPLDRVDAKLLTVTPVTGRPGVYKVAASLKRPILADLAKGQYLEAGYPFFIDAHTGGSDIELTVRTVVPAANGSFNAPILGTSTLVLPLSSQLTRSKGWAERLEPTIPLTSASQYELVLRDRLVLTDAHPRDTLWIGVSAADDQAYVPDTFVGITSRPGNESAVAAVQCQGKKYLPPEYNPSGPSGPVERIIAPEPVPGGIRFMLDFTSLMTGSGLQSSDMVFHERLHENDLLAAYEVQGGQLRAKADASTQPVTIPNVVDRALIVQALSQSGPAILEDRLLVLLAHYHPFRAKLFRAINEQASSTIGFEERLPASPARYVYRVRRANLAGQLSQEGFIPSALVYVPSLTPGPRPIPAQRRSQDPLVSLRFAVPLEGATHLLYFRDTVMQNTEADLIRVPDRPDLHPVGHLRLILADGTQLAPIAIALAAQERSAEGYSVLIAPESSWVGPQRLWAITVTSDGMPSPLTGPWRMDIPPPPLVMPTLSVQVTASAHRLTWTWPTGPRAPLIVEASIDGSSWRRLSAPQATSRTSYEVTERAVPVRYRLKAQSQSSNVVQV